MSLLPQDVLVALKLALEKERPAYAQLAAELGLSPSQAHQSVRRAAESGLLVPGTLQVNRRALEEFLIHGLKYVFPARRGPLARGVPTAHSAPPLDKLIVDDGAPLVWPDSEGMVRGETLEPIYKTAPMAARRDPRLYASLALIDAIRAGRARERKLAAVKLQELLARAP
jgi:DNA-binding Lrp family transcriptional regulator